MGVWDLDSESGLLRLDATLADILGRPELAYQEISTETLIAFAHPEHLSEVREMSEALLRGDHEQTNLEHMIINGRGETVWIKVYIRIVDRDHNDLPIRMIGIVEDLTQHKRAEDTLKAALAHAEAASEAKSQFLANMSHE
ncbi:MAG TPA: hypothetical protein DEB67_00590, partial [Oceanicaulis sp.]|nr:hypothetical protein [Oceanicaulis sp.]